MSSTATLASRNDIRSYNDNNNRQQLRSLLKYVIQRRRGPLDSSDAKEVEKGKRYRVVFIVPQQRQQAHPSHKACQRYTFQSKNKSGIVKYLNRDLLLWSVITNQIELADLCLS
ncbi:unnamed protein product [Didymodactylos carnosus]|uniref:Uncharacterized protein n=2 Tax=Didymodactylos carnosus TaxID=1234261 RepID=A0A816AR61_9BILA|nr:unnamed protein product [Didymodactylos carnosus]CAF4474040.1 unnamed protein product [Didymodactylos carnosus]